MSPRASGELWTKSSTWLPQNDTSSPVRSTSSHLRMLFGHDIGPKSTSQHAHATTLLEDKNRHGNFRNCRPSGARERGKRARTTFGGGNDKWGGGVRAAFMMKDTQMRYKVDQKRPEALNRCTHCLSPSKWPRYSAPMVHLRRVAAFPRGRAQRLCWVPKRARATAGVRYVPLGPDAEEVARTSHVGLGNGFSARGEPRGARACSSGIRL